eukprot:756203-Hanusia_phi.AAC.2
MAVLAASLPDSSGGITRPPREPKDNLELTTSETFGMCSMCTYLGRAWSMWLKGPGAGVCTKVATAASPEPRMKAAEWSDFMATTVLYLSSFLQMPLDMATSEFVTPAAHPTRNRAERIARALWARA